MDNYSVHIQSGRTTGDLWTIIQNPTEPLRSYIKRLTRTLSELSKYEDGVALEALKQGLLHKSPFKAHICRFPPIDVQAALILARGFCDCEDEDRRVERTARERRGASNTPMSQPNRHDYNVSHDREPRSEARKQKENWSNQRPPKRDDRAPLPPDYNLNIEADDLVCLHLKDKEYVKWPRQQDLGGRADKYCEFHRGKGHATVDCRALKQEIVELLKKGHLTEFLSEEGCKTYGLDRENKMVARCDEDEKALKKKEHHHHPRFESWL